MNQSPVPQLERPIEVGFFDALRATLKGKRITRVAWGNSDYGMVRETLLKIKRDDTWYNWIISTADMEAGDWVVLE